MTAAAVGNKTHAATYTAEEYLVLEVESDTRSEFRDGGDSAHDWRNASAQRDCR